MEKIDRLLDAIEHPETYTPTEIEAMLQDPEVKEVLDLLDKTKSSLQTVTTPDIDEEWKRFEVNRRKRVVFSRFNLPRIFTRNAAASIVIATASVTAVAALVGVGIYRTHHRLEEKQIDSTPTAFEDKTFADTIKVIEPQDSVDVQTIVFEDEPLEAVLNRMAEYYGYQVEFGEESSKSLRLYFRWNQNLTIDEAVNRLNNFEQIHLSVKSKTIKVD